MNHNLLERLSHVTPEEQAILDGVGSIDRSLYYRKERPRAGPDQVDASIVLANGKLIDIRPHTRFVHFPKHTHNYVEFIYMCSGSTTHLIDGTRICLREGDLLFMNQHAEQEILPAGRDDIAVNFMILPQFFDSVLRAMEDASSSLRDFLIRCLTERDMGGNYLYFDAAGILPVQNLMENMIWIMLNEPPNRRTLSQSTIALLFLTLTDYADHIHGSDSSFEQNLLLRLLGYIESDYRDASLAKFCAGAGTDIYSMGRITKKITGKTFKELLIEKRMSQAVYLLLHTDLPVTDIAYSVGYENTSYFHRVFRDSFGMSPRVYRSERAPSFKEARSASTSLRFS